MDAVEDVDDPFGSISLCTVEGDHQSQQDQEKLVLEELADIFAKTNNQVKFVF